MTNKEAEKAVVDILVRQLQWSYPEPLAMAQESDKGRTLGSWAKEIVAAVEASQSVEPNYEYGVRTKWGISGGYLTHDGAKLYGDRIRADIESGRSSGDLKYHGKIVRRSVERVGEWEPVE